LRDSCVSEVLDRPVVAAKQAAAECRFDIAPNIPHACPAFTLLGHLTARLAFADTDYGDQVGPKPIKCSPLCADDGCRHACRQPLSGPVRRTYKN
jgi:hypothetical protein